MRERFTSIRWPIAVDEARGRLAPETDYVAHAEQLMRQVLLTNPGERVNRPDFGCGLRRMVFAPNSDINANLVQVTVIQALEKWLASVLTVETVKVVSEEEKLLVTIVYVLRTRPERRYLNVEVIP
jgi:uncharacterized protein